MPETDAPGLTQADVLALLSQQPSTFLADSNNNPLTVATLLANYPAGAGYIGKYARVTDFCGDIDEVMRCRKDATGYRWVPQRTDAVGTMTATSGAISLVPLVTPQTVRLTGNLLGNMTVTPSTVGAWMGQRYRVIQSGALGLFTSTITGLLGSNVTLLGNTAREIEFGTGGWFQST